MDNGSPSPRGPGYGFAAAVQEPAGEAAAPQVRLRDLGLGLLRLASRPPRSYGYRTRDLGLRLQRPKFDFEIWDWGYFAWPHDRLEANLEMRDSDPEATLEADRKASESFLNRSALLLDSYVMNQDIQEQHAAAWPPEQLDGVNLEMKDSTAGESFLNQSKLQLESFATAQYTQEQNAITLPHNQHSANKGTGDSKRMGTLEADQKASDSLLSQSTLQQKREMNQDQHRQEQQKKPKLRTSVLHNVNAVGSRLTRRHRGCAEANGILDHGRAMQGTWAWWIISSGLLPCLRGGWTGLTCFFIC